MPLTTGTIFAVRYPCAEGTDRGKRNNKKPKHSIYKKKKKIHTKKLQYPTFYTP
jgi:hypothetical protein